jgi:hypothetical protein
VTYTWPTLPCALKLTAAALEVAADAGDATNNAPATAAIVNTQRAPPGLLKQQPLLMARQTESCLEVFRRASARDDAPQPPI